LPENSQLSSPNSSFCASTTIIFLWLLMSNQK
jgi:hypothetical protein